MENYKKEFIEFIVKSEVLKFGDFITKSGRKTPFFINTGNFNKGSQLKKLGHFYAKAILKQFKDDFDVIFGPAYKGIPLSVATCIALEELSNKDVFFSSNRKEIKDHGDTGIFLGKKISGKLKVIIIEDVTTAGTSIRETMPIIKNDPNVEVVGLIVAVDRMEKGTTRLSALKQIEKDYNMKVCSIVNMEEVRKYLLDNNINGKYVINSEIDKMITEYYKIYGV